MFIGKMRWTNCRLQYKRILPKQTLRQSAYYKLTNINVATKSTQPNWPTIVRPLSTPARYTRDSGNFTAVLDTQSTWQVDFFEEPVTFFLEDGDRKRIDSINETLISLDSFIVQYVTRGKASNDGGDEFGISAKAAHSTAIPWSELIMNMSQWCELEGNDLKCKVPMLACAAVSPLIAIGGLSYLQHIDKSYLSSMKYSLRQMAEAAVKCLSDGTVNDLLSEREKYHLQTLDFLLQNEHINALESIRKLLEVCPGDAFGLSLAMDLSSSLADKHNAFQSATSVASYWNERGQRSATGQTAIPGYAIGSSFIALGLAVGGRYREAERLVDIALSRDNESSGVCAWALANIYDCEGRVGEGTSTFTGFGVEYYEKCGFLFTDTMLAGVGGAMVLDRDGATADNVATRLYDEYFGRVLEYSGYIDSSEGPVIRFAPKSNRNMAVETATGAATSLVNKLFGTTPNQQTKDGEVMDQENNESTSRRHTLVDIFAWLPPHSNFLTNATLLLFRLIVNGTISANDERCNLLQKAWEREIEIEKKFCPDGPLYKNFPLSRIAALLVLGDDHFREDAQYQSNQLECAIATMGGLMNLNKSYSEGGEAMWIKVVQDLSDFRKKDSRFGWNLNFGNFLEHSICHSAMQTENHEVLCIARSVCSESIALKPNSPGTWFRYGLLLEKLGDEENAHNAFKASVSLGSGEGGRMSPT